jgi:transcriptional regulator with XRE-family HTH domain
MKKVGVSMDNLNTIDANIIASNIKTLRENLKLSQEEMAWKLGYSDRQLRRIERDGTNSISVINYIATTFNVPAISILIKDAF